MGFVVYLINTPVHSNGRLHRTMHDLTQIDLCLALFQQDFKRYPSTAEGLQKLCERNAQGESYILISLPQDGWGHDFIYRETPNATHPYVLYSIGENGIDERGAGDDIDIWAQEK
ncbi:MAG: type II secretion system protein GspG [Pseudomonadota bacterium]